MCSTSVHFRESESLRELPINSPQKKNVSGRSLRANYVRYVFSVVWWGVRGGEEMETNAAPLAHASRVFPLPLNHPLTTDEE